MGSVSKLLGVAIFIVMLAIAAKSVSAIDVNDCGTLSTGWSTYDLTRDINSSGTCINIGASNIIIDCHGFMVNHSNTGDSTYGIRNIGGYDNITIRGCNITQGGNTFSVFGIDISTNADDCKIFNNTITTKSGNSFGISAATGSDNYNITNNTIITTSGASIGIYLSSSEYHNIYDNIITTTGSGIFLSLSYPNNISRNTITTTGATAHGIYLSNVITGNNITDNSITTSNSNAFGIVFSQSSRSNIIRNRISTSGSGSYGIWSDDSFNNTIKDTVIIASSANDIYLRGDGYNDFINVTFDSSDVGFDLPGDPSIINVFWYADVYVNDTLGGPVSGANVTVYDDNYDLKNWSLTNSSGYTPRLTLREYLQNATAKYFDTNYTFNTTTGGSPATEQVNLTGNRITDDGTEVVLMLPDAFISSCKNLDTSNANYFLTADITDSNNSTCMNVTANDVLLDCQGNSIDGNGTSGTFGVLINGANNVTIRNCSISDWWYGVYMDSDSNITVSGGNFSGNNIGVDVIGSSECSVNDNILDSTVTNIVMNGSSDNHVSGNAISNGNRGISFIESSAGNTFSGNTLDSFNDYAIYIHTSANNIFRDSNITTSSTNVYHFVASDTTFLNVTLDETKISVDAGAVYLKWYVDVRALSERGPALEGANVTGKDKDNSTVFSELTAASGYIERQNVTGFHQNFSGKFFYSNYTINATLQNFAPNHTSVNVTGNEVVMIYLSPPETPLVQLKTYTHGLAEREMFRPGDAVRIRATVTSSLGRTYISNSTVFMENNLGSTVLNNELMTNVSEVTNGYIYEYNYTIPDTASGLWFINVTAIDSFGGRGSDHKKIAISPLTIQIKLILNSTGDKIYIPGTGEKTFSTLTTTEYSTPDHYYVASYSNDVLKSMVFSHTNPISVITEKGSSVYGIGTSQRFSNSGVFIVFSRGNWRNVNNRIDSVEKNEFLLSPKPSFSYGMGKSYLFKVLLEYGNIDINRTVNIQRGFNRLIIEKKGTIGDKVNIEIRRA